MLFGSSGGLGAVLHGILKEEEHGQSGHAAL